MYHPGWPGADFARPHVESFCASRPNANIYDAKPGINGAWSRLLASGVRCVYLGAAESKLLGGSRRAFTQSIGRCVSLGFGRAIEDQMCLQIVNGGIGRPVEISTEVLYGGSRVNVGRGQLGSSDGSVGAWAAQWIHDYGLMERQSVGRYDLHVDREDWAQWLGNNGVDETLIAVHHKGIVAACHQVATVEEIADALAAGHTVARCCSTIWSQYRGQNGICRPASSGGHCQEMVGICRLPNGTDVFLTQQSWGDIPSGNSRLEYDDGFVDLREGLYGEYWSDVDDALRGSGGDNWAIELNLAESFR